ncbi:uncharacterized protein LOC135196668 [Macrobrachium nipponense]|uniref:uncharacterized protein LOC135196668 n=1 Tax=Macrobrachium nipponense TaxID=159736 RepID=UPI0030C7D691
MSSVLCHGCPNASGLIVLTLLAAATTRYTVIVLEEVSASWDPSCNQGCISTHLSGAPTWNDPDLIDAIRNYFLLPPLRIPDASPADVSTFVWREVADWSRMQKKLLELWKDQPPGTFVEVGVVDGLFMSQTLLLERNLNWTGLLIEPDPRSFSRLRQSRRNATVTDFAVVPKVPPGAEVNHGSKVYVKGAPLSTLLLAAKMTRVDLLTIATGTSDDRRKVTDVIGSDRGFDVKSILIQYQRDLLSKNPYPQVKGYVYDMGRSSLLVRLYWKRTHCHPLEGNECKRQNYFDLTEGCSRYICDGHAVVWSF